MKEFKYKITVITPIYNVEEYLEEAILSIVNQSIGFEKNIQLILVNDGSTDGSAEICCRYWEMYPENIIYISKENGGISSARNAGIPLMEGKYVNFMDSDDKWDKHALQLLYDFFEDNYDTIDVVAGRFCYFDRQEGFLHPLDFRFDSNRIIDIDAEPSSPQMNAASVLFKSETVREYTFDTEQQHAEDAAFLSEILLRRKAYGVMRDAVYGYRKRQARTSVMDTSRNRRSWYCDTLQHFHRKLINLSLEKYGKVIPYIQYVLLYDLRGRLNTPLPGIIDDDLKKRYSDMLIDILKNIDDKAIIKQKKVSVPYKIFALSLKHDTDIMQKVKFDKNRIMYRKMQLFKLNGPARFKINILRIRDGILYLDGTHQFDMLHRAYSIYAKDNNGRVYKPEFFPAAAYDLKAFTGETILKMQGFRLSIPLEKVKSVRFILKTAGRKILLTPSFGKYAKINRLQKNSYYHHEDYIAKFKDDRIIIIRANALRIMLAEMRYLRDTVLKEREYAVAVYRISCIIGKLLRKKDIWIVSDRSDLAGDNGEAFFRYLMKQERLPADVYFMLERNSVDCGRLKKVGKVLFTGSVKYRMKFLRAKKIISAHNGIMSDEFGEKRKFLNDMYDFDFVFLQHGIINNELSRILHRFKKNIDMFITSTNAEYDNILHGGYGYTEKHVKLTGMARYDRLENKPEKKLVILPTWRSSIAPGMVKKSFERFYSEEFKKTEYFRFYNNLINDKRLLEALKKFGYKGEFYVHPVFKKQQKDFTENDIIQVPNHTANYQDVFKTSALMVTDFSSVAFDFAYLKKPLIYAQFDREDYFRSHYEKGYFDHERDGFGPVCLTYEETVSAIIRYIESGCRMEEMYQQRVNSFFRWNDRRNSERIYNEIIRM